MFDLIRYIIVGVAFLGFGAYVFFVTAPSFANEQKLYAELCERGDTVSAVVRNEYKEIQFETNSVKRGNRTSITYEVYYDYKVNNEDHLLTLEVTELPSSRNVVLHYLPEDPAAARPGNVCMLASVKDNGLSKALTFVSALLAFVGALSIFKTIKLAVRKKEQ